MDKQPVMDRQPGRNTRHQKTVIIGAGISGLTAAAYLVRGGHEVVVLEKTGECGGLVASFWREGFLFDTGPRAFGNAGILIPLLEELGLDLPLVPGKVSTGIADRIVHHDTEAGREEFLDSLVRLFPDSRADIRRIRRLVRTCCRTSRTMNHMPNPFFKKIFSDPRFFLTEFLPRIPGFLLALVRIFLTRKPMEKVLQSLSADPALRDMLSQHFFKRTPAGFALGYFENFLDYLYPVGGTGRLPESLAGFVRSGGGKILTDTEIIRIDPVLKKVKDDQGREYSYDHLLWCADLKSLYGLTSLENLAPRTARKVRKEEARYKSCGNGESVFTLFLGLDETPEYFAGLSRGHFIHTPSARGLGELHRSTLDRLKSDFSRVGKTEVFCWIAEFCRYNSYEISIPVLKDPALAPPGKTGLVVSLLLDGDLVRMVREAGWYVEFKQEMSRAMIRTLEDSVYPGLGSKILFQDASSPLTLADRFNISGGAITGWSMEARVPVPRSLLRVASTPHTAIPGVYKAGQWSYSPSGVPVAILTGRIAASRMVSAARLG